MRHAIHLATILIAALLLQGCKQYVTRGEFDQTVSGLNAKDAELAGQLGDMNDLFGEMAGQLNTKFGEYDAQIAQIEGRLRVDMTAHFAYDDATLRPEDHSSLDQFVQVVRGHESNVIVTVEGFTDPAGDPEYNKWLGLQRAKAVADYLVDVGGLSESNVRAVSYGEDDERLIKPGAWGKTGAANRRVALVVDYVAKPQS